MSRGRIIIKGEYDIDLEHYAGAKTVEEAIKIDADNYAAGEASVYDLVDILVESSQMSVDVSFEVVAE